MLNTLNVYQISSQIEMVTFVVVGKIFKLIFEKDATVLLKDWGTNKYVFKISNKRSGEYDIILKLILK